MNGRLKMQHKEESLFEEKYHFDGSEITFHYLECRCPRCKNVYNVPIPPTYIDWEEEAKIYKKMWLDASRILAARMREDES